MVFFSNIYCESEWKNPCRSSKFISDLFEFIHLIKSQPKPGSQMKGADETSTDEGYLPTNVFPEHSLILYLTFNTASHTFVFLFIYMAIIVYLKTHLISLNFITGFK